MRLQDASWDIEEGGAEEQPAVTGKGRQTTMTTQLGARKNHDHVAELALIWKAGKLLLHQKCSSIGHSVFT